jgi:hypothetical protein
MESSAIAVCDDGDLTETPWSGVTRLLHIMRRSGVRFPEAAPKPFRPASAYAEGLSKGSSVWSDRRVRVGSSYLILRDRPAVSRMRVRTKSAKLSEHSNNAERRRDHSSLSA